MSNTPEGGYNSPGFAQLIWQELGRAPAFTDLPRDAGEPRPVVGMTPFGIAALNYDFGVARVAVLRTGLGN
jgi:hypothetical protein